ncbi:MAG TPA: SDR family oxidoreductase [Polyangiaceae bacterium]|nr:SDR family oxidoreductase [Polyangiaceae bacterium]
MATALITGANRGIGLSFAKLLKARGDTVIAACRRDTPELAALGVEVASGVDVTSDKSLNLLAEKLKGRTLDVLVNNAGLLASESFDALDFASIQRQMEVNAYGPLRVTYKLSTLLKRGSKVALITSRMGSIGDNTSGGMYGYRMSKAALNAAGKSLAHDLKRLGVAVAILHPGYVRTQMTGDHGNVEPDDAARALLTRIDELGLENSGTFWHANGEVLPW